MADSFINYSPAPRRRPLPEKNLRQIYGSCRSSKARAGVLRREISVVTANFRWGYVDQAQGIAALDIIRSMLIGGRP